MHETCVFMIQCVALPTLSWHLPQRYFFSKMTTAVPVGLFVIFCCCCFGVISKAENKENSSILPW